MHVTSAEIGSYFVGDMPADPALIYVDGDLSRFPNADVKLRKPDGTAQVLSGVATVQPEEDAVQVTLSGNYFTAPGHWTAQLMLTGSGVKETLAPVGFIVEEEDGWLDLYTSRNEWRDAPSDDLTLYRILQVVKLQVLEYAPSLGTPAVEVPGIIWDDPELPLVPSNWVEDPDNPGFFFAADAPLPRPPANYVLAQKMQARNVWNAAKTDPSGGNGDPSYEIRPYPMDNFIKKIIRPLRAGPVVG